MRMDVATRVTLLPGGHPGSTLSRTWGKKRVLENPREAAPGDGVRLGGAVLVRRRHGKAVGSETCMLLLPLSPVVWSLYCEDVAKLFGHQQIKDDCEERDKTQIMWGGWNVSSFSDASANWWILFVSSAVRDNQSESGMDGIQRWSQSSFIFFLTGAGSRSSLSVNFFSRKSLVPTSERASIILQVIVSTTKGFCVSKEPDLIR